MKEAYHLVKKKKKAVYRAARECGVPVQTLRDRIASGLDVKPTHGSPTLLPEEKEKELVEYILYRASCDYPLSVKEIIQLATDTAVYLRKRPANTSVTQCWFRRLIGRWPELHQLKAEEKKTVTSAEKSNKYFRALANVMRKHGLMDKPEQIFMVTEIDFHTVSNKVSVADPESCEQNEKAADPDKTARILACGNAAGTALPPYFVFMGQRCKMHLLEDGLPGVGGKASLDGCSDPFIYQHFLHHFIKECPRRHKSQHVLLLHDRQFSRISMPTITKATRHKVILFALPSYASNVSQPLDDCLRKPLKICFQAECERHLAENPFQVIIREQICGLVCKAYVKAFTPTKLTDSFNNIGIFPPSLNHEIEIDGEPAASPKQTDCEQDKLECESPISCSEIEIYGETAAIPKQTACEQDKLKCEPLSSCSEIEIDSEPAASQKQTECEQDKLECEPPISCSEIEIYGEPVTSPKQTACEQDKLELQDQQEQV